MRRQVDRRELDFWRRQLRATRPILELPLDHRRRGRYSYQYEEVPFRISADVQLSMEDLARQQRSALSSLYLAAFAILLSRYGNSRELLIGLPDEPKAFSTDLSPSTFIRVNCRPQRSFTRVVRMIDNALAAIRQHGAVPLPMLSRLLKLSIQPGRGLVCDVCFVGDENTNRGRHFRACRGTPDYRRRRVPAPPCDLGLKICPRNNDMTLCWIYRTDLFDFRSIERMSWRFTQLLRQVGRDPRGSVWTLGMMPGDKEPRA